jgi:hypothetical protein
MAEASVADQSGTTAKSVGFLSNDWLQRKEKNSAPYLGPAPLDERVELASDAWLATAEATLRRLTRAFAPELKGVSFSISETFTDTPPHLKMPGNVAAWNVVIENAELSVSRGPNENADVRIVADYQKMLPIAQAVGSIAMDRAGAQQRHLFGDGWMRMEGQPPTGRIADIFMELHDHLARRTLENPDLQHRIERQNLRRQVDQLAENGYAVLENAITPAFADELRALSIDEMLSHKSPNNLSGRIDSMGLLSRGRPFEEIVQHPTLRTLIESSLGPAMVLQTVSCAMKMPGPSAVPLHTDYGAVPDPYPAFSLLGVAVWALEDWTVASGPTWIIPGSNRRRRSPTPVDSLDGGVPIEMPKGSVVFFADGVWHWQGDRTEPGSRVSLHNGYQRPFIRQVDDFSIDLDAALHRNSPVLSGLAGRDDFFDRSTYDGHDMRRLAYMDSQLKWRNLTLGG